MSIRARTLKFIKIADTWHHIESQSVEHKIESNLRGQKHSADRIVHKEIFMELTEMLAHVAHKSEISQDLIGLFVQRILWPKAEEQTATERISLVKGIIGTQSP